MDNSVRSGPGLRPGSSSFFFSGMHPSLGVRSAIHRHQLAQRTVLGQVDCFVQCEVVGFQIALDGVQSRVRGRPGGIFRLSGGGAVRIIMASASSLIRAICPNMERRRDWIIAVRSGCLVIRDAWRFLSSSRASWFYSLKVFIGELLGRWSHNITEVAHNVSNGRTNAGLCRHSVSFARDFSVVCTSRPSADSRHTK